MSPKQNSIQKCLSGDSLMEEFSHDYDIPYTGAQKPRECKKAKKMAPLDRMNKAMFYGNI